MNKKTRKKIKKKWKPVPGEKFYFIYVTTSICMHNEDPSGHIDLNNDQDYLVIGEAESYDPYFDTKNNCFRTKRQAQKALSLIRKALKFTGA